MGPKFLRVVPDLDLVPRENSQREEDAGGKPGEQEGLSSPIGEQAGASQDRPSEACQVGVSISGNLRAALKDPEYREKDNHVCEPGRWQARPAAAAGPRERSDGHQPAVAQEEQRRPWIHQAPLVK